MVLNDEHGEVEAVADLTDKIHQRERFLRVHTGGRLVEQQKLRVGCQRAGDFQLALLAVGQVDGDHIALIPDAHDLEQLFRLLAQRLFLPVVLRQPLGAELEAPEGLENVVVRARMAGREHVVVHRFALKKADILEGARHAAGHDVVSPNEYYHYITTGEYPAGMLPLWVK